MAPSNYVRFVLKPEDMKHLIELLGDQEDALVYRLKAKWLEYQDEQAPTTKPTKKARS